MANAKPGTLCKLKRGLAIGAQPHFTATMNWIIDLVDELTDGAYTVKKMEFVTDVKYDPATHSLTQKKAKINAIVPNVTAKAGNNGEVIFTATPISDYLD